jgi:hypothetical protein
MNQQQFDLQVFDHLQTDNPADPLVGLDIQGTISVTINWTDDGTALTDKGVEFAAPQWSGPGIGPFTVYRNLGGGMLKPIETVSWMTATSTMKHRETDAAAKKFRWVITPIVKLMRQRTPKGGGAPVIEFAYTAANPVKGAWKAIP